MVFCSLLLCSWVFVAYDVGWVVIDILVGKVWLVAWITGLGFVGLGVWCGLLFGACVWFCIPLYACRWVGGLVVWWFGDLV